MRPRIAEILRPIQESAAGALSRLDRVGEQRVEPIDDRRLAAGVSAVVTLTSGPVRHLVIGCDEGLARAIATRLLPPHDPSDPADTDENRLVAGFQIALHTYLATLADSASWFRPSEERIEYGPGSFEARSVGRRTFLVETHADGGAMHVIVGLSNDLREETEVDILPRATGRSYELTEEERETVIACLVAAELDVEIEVPSDGREVATSSATVVDADPDAGLIALSSPCLTKRNVHVGPGTRIWMNFPNNGSFYRFSSMVEWSPRTSLADGIEIPLLWIRSPSTILRTERRRAFRVTPNEHVSASVEEWAPDGQPETPPISCDDATVKDVSHAGLRLATRRELDETARGRLVLVQFDLPNGWGLVGLPGIVRHAEPTASGSEIGIEFISVPAWRSFDGARQRIRQYVIAETRTRLPNESVSRD